MNSISTALSFLLSWILVFKCSCFQKGQSYFAVDLSWTGSMPWCPSLTFILALTEILFKHSVMTFTAKNVTPNVENCL